MTKITNVDQVLMLLRQQLQRTDKSGNTNKLTKAGRKGPEKRKPAAGRIEEISRSANLSDEELSRNFVAAILVDEFGESVANDHRFQTLASEVHRIISTDADAKELLQSALQTAIQASGKA